MYIFCHWKKIFFLWSLVILLSAALSMGNAPLAGAESAPPQDAPLYRGIVVKVRGSDTLYNITRLSKADEDFLLENYKDNPQIEYAEPNYLYQAALIPNDPEYFRQWYLPHIKAPQGWEFSQGSKDIVVAVLDTGIDVDHPDLRDNMWVNEGEKPYDKIDNDRNGFVDDFYGWNFVENNNDVNPVIPGANETAVHHGTVVAGVIGARGSNNSGISGVSWRVRIMAIKVLDNQGRGDTLTVTRGIDYAIAHGADVINLSLVGQEFSQSLSAAIKRAFDNDIVVVASAGNERFQGHNLDITPSYPVCNDGSDNFVIGVAAVGPANTLAPFSNFGSICVDVLAPGVDFFSTVFYNPSQEQYRALYRGGWSGTSVAAPLVSGLAALVKSVNPSLSAVQIRNIILNTARDVSGLQSPDVQSALGRGLIDVGDALRAAQATVTAGSRRIERDQFVVVGPGPGGGPHVRILDYQGNVLGQWFAYDKGFRGGVSVSSGDVDGDGIAEVITGSGPGHTPEVKIFDSQGNLKAQWFAYDKGFRGGVSVSSGDVDGDGIAEVITGAGPGGGPHVRIFDNSGRVKGQFMAYTPAFRGGVSVASGDINLDGRSEIITGAGPGGGPHVRVFALKGDILSEFMAYSPAFRGGVNVTVGDADNNGQQEILTAPSSRGGPHIRIFSSTGSLVSQWFALDPLYRGELTLVVADFNGDGLEQIAVGSGKGIDPRVTFFDWLGNKQSDLIVYNPAFSGGVHVSALKE